MTVQSQHAHCQMTNDNLTIRPTSTADLAALEAVHTAAFPTDLEARLVKLLISRGQAAVSLAAVAEGRIVGHDLFSQTTCEGSTGVTRGLGLAPLAVLPEFERQGIGSALVRAGLEACQRQYTPWVVVLGEPAYYSRFGFQPASRYGLSGDFGGGDAFQILVFNEQQSPDPGGHIRYDAEFRKLFGSNTIELTPQEQLEFWNALQQPVHLTPAQKELGTMIRGK
jgi:predicted N-acetyltransferase YhbS